MLTVGLDVVADNRLISEFVQTTKKLLEKIKKRTLPPEFNKFLFDFIFYLAYKCENTSGQRFIPLLLRADRMTEQDAIDSFQRYVAYLDTQSPRAYTASGFIHPDVTIELPSSELESAYRTLWALAHITSFPCAQLCTIAFALDNLIGIGQQDAPMYSGAYFFIARAMLPSSNKKNNEDMQLTDSMLLWEACQALFPLENVELSPLDTIPYQPIHREVRRGNLEKCKEIYQKNPDVLKWRTHDDDRFTPLHMAAIFEQEAIFEWLIETGANPRFQTLQGLNVLHVAAKYRRSKIVALLLKNPKLDTNITDSLGHTALYHAVTNFQPGSNRKNETKRDTQIDNLAAIIADLKNAKAVFSDTDVTAFRVSDHASLLQILLSVGLNSLALEILNNPKTDYTTPMRLDDGQLVTPLMHAQSKRNAAEKTKTLDQTKPLSDIIAKIESLLMQKSSAAQNSSSATKVVILNTSNPNSTNISKAPVPNGSFCSPLTASVKIQDIPQAVVIKKQKLSCN